MIDVDANRRADVRRDIHSIAGHYWFDAGIIVRLRAPRDYREARGKVYGAKSLLTELMPMNPSTAIESSPGVPRLLDQATTVPTASTWCMAKTV